jgi:hypothetical protein
MKTLEDADLNSLIGELEKRDHIKIEEQSVSYGRAVVGR